MQLIKSFLRVGFWGPCAEIMFPLQSSYLTLPLLPVEIRDIKKEKDFLRVSIGSFLSGFWSFFTHNNYGHIPMILWFPFMICLPPFGGFISFSNCKTFYSCIMKEEYTTWKYYVLITWYKRLSTFKSIVNSIYIYTHTYMIKRL